MNDVQIRPIEQRLERYDAIVAGKARFYAKDGKLLADVSTDEPVLRVDIDGEREWAKDALQQLQAHHFRQMDSFNSYCIASKESEQFDEATFQEQVRVFRSEIHRITELIAKLKLYLEMLQEKLRVWVEEEIVVFDETYDGVFNKALPAFKKHIQNCFRDRSEEFRKRLFEVIAEKERLARQKTGFQTEINHVSLRISLCNEHAPRLGGDFLNAFDSIIKPYCGIISNSSKAILTKLLSEQYRFLIAQQESSFKAMAASMGRDEDFKSWFLRVQGTYQHALSSCSDRLDAEIEKHNLEVSAKPPVVFKTKTSGQPIDQDDMIDKFRSACEKRNLVKFKTIPQEELYKISKEAGFKDLPTLEQFKDGNPAYHTARQYASLTQYSKKRNWKERT